MYQLGAQTPPVPVQGAYKNPSELITQEEVLNLENDYRALLSNPDQGREKAFQIISRGSGLLTRFYSQFTEGRRIEYERRTEPLLTSGFDVNALRLHALQMNRTVQSSSFLGHSPYLNRIHYVMGMASELTDDKAAAVRHYKSALRFVRLQPFTELIPPPEKAESLTVFLSQIVTPENYLSIYKEYLKYRQEAAVFQEQMDIGFADKYRLAEETDPVIRDYALRTSEILKEMPVLIRRMESDRKSASEDLRDSGLKQTAAASLNALLQKEKMLHEIRTTEFARYAAMRSRTDGELVFRLARILKDQEHLLREEDAYAKRDSFSAGMGDSPLESWQGLPGNYTAYERYLETAHRTDPLNPEYIALLSEQVKRRRHTERALMYEEKYINNIIKYRKNADQSALSERYLSAAGLYNDQRNYIKSAENFEKYLELSIDPLPGDTSPAAELLRSRRTEAILHLGEIHLRRTQRPDRASELLEEGLRRINESVSWEEKQVTPEDLRDHRNEDFKLPDSLASLTPQERLNFLRRRFQLYRDLAYLSQKRKYTEAQISWTERAVRDFRYLEEDRRILEAEAAELRRQSDTLKQDLLNQENEEKQREYYILLRTRQPALSRQISFLNGAVNSLAPVTMLLSLADLRMNENRLTEASALYEEIVRKGNGPQIAEARRKLKSIERLQREGRREDQSAF